MEISPRAYQQLDEYVTYIHSILKNKQAAQNVWEDARETADLLKTSAGSLRFCPDERLSALGYHQIKFLHHDYVMIYHIEESVARVDAVYHIKQDYPKKFIDE